MATKKRRGERKDGLIQVSLQIGYKEDGRPDRKYFYGHSRAEAERKRDAYKAAHETRPDLSGEMLLSDWVEVVKSTFRKGVDEAYITNDNVPYTRLVNELGKMRVVDVREAHLQQALNKVAGTSSSNVTKYMAVIKKVFRKARTNRLIKDDPAEDLERPPSTEGTHRALERDEVNFILDHWNDPGVRAGLWVMIMLLCGLRRSELIALCWENIDLENRVLRVNQVAVTATNKTSIVQRAKTDAGIRTLPICNTLLAALKTVPPEKRTGYVALSTKGTLLTEQSFRRGFKSFLTSMQLISEGKPPKQQGRRTDLEDENTEPAAPVFHEPVRSHDLRHSFATALYDAGVPVKAAQYFLGHSDVKITMELYTHLSHERELASKLQMVSYLDSWVEMRSLEAVRTAALEGALDE